MATRELLQELKEKRHREDIISRPERHNPTTDTLNSDADVCQLCVRNWIDNYWFDASNYVMRKIINDNQ